MVNDDLLHKWINNSLTKEELAQFQKRPEYESLVSLYKQTEGLSAPVFDQDAMLADILAPDKSTLQKTEHTISPPITKERSFTSWFKLGIAASFLLVAGYFTGKSLAADQLISYEIAEGQEMQGTLPDQSTFELKDNSTLQYAAKDWDNKRDINLTGTAAFKVNKGSVFTVKTPTGSVEVLGTAFSVSSREDWLEVVCTEGKVAVNAPTRDKYKEVLIASESAYVNLDGRSKTFKKNLTKLHKVTLKEVTTALSDTYNLSWNTAEVNLDEKLSCNFKHDNLEMALKTALEPLNLNYTLVGNTVELSI